MLKIYELSHLSDDETLSIYQAPALIAVLIAASDNQIDEQETSWASKVMAYRQQVGDKALFGYYDIADTYFETTLNGLLQGKETQEIIENALAALTAINGTLAKVDAAFAERLVKSWRSFAKTVAETSGGFLGFGNISPQEAELIKLDMFEF
jgi:hypothetical protein